MAKHNRIRKSLLFLGLTLIVITTQCKKPAQNTPSPTPVSDQIPPVITLKGKAIDTVFLGSTYSDPGATANDNVDGDISGFIIVSGAVNTSVVGNNTKEYNVRDAAGNAAVKQTRTVRVQNNAGFMDGNYTAVCNCTISNPGVSTPTVNNNTYTTGVVSSTTINGFATLGLYPILGQTINYNPVGFSLTSKAITFSPRNGLSPANGNGNSLNNNSFTLTSTHYDNDYPNRSMECKVTLTRN